MVSSVLNVGIFIVLVVLLAVNLGNLAYLFGLITGFIQNLFSLTSYFGASCNDITIVSSMFMGAVILLLIAKIYSMFKPNGS